MTALNLSQASSPKVTKRKKPGIFRTQLLLLIGVFSVVTWIYVAFFFDQHLKMLLTWGLEKVNGAEVNIAKVRTSWTSLSLEIGSLQVTNSASPQENLVAFDDLIFNLNTYQLLKAKLVIEEASLFGLRFHDLRQKPGKVFPVPPEDEKKNPNPFVQAFERKKQEWIKGQWENSALAQVLTLFKSEDIEKEAKKYLDQLQTTVHLKTLESNFEQASQQWKSISSDRSLLDKWKQREGEFKNFKLSQNPLEASKQLEQVKHWKEELGEDISKYQQYIQKLKNQIGTFKGQLDLVPTWINQDLLQIQQSLKLPQLDPGAFARGIWEPFIFGKIGPYLSYWHKAQPYWQKWQQRQKEKAPEPTKRSGGVNFHFPQIGEAPKFWLQKMGISVRKASDYAIAGEIKHISSAPASLGLPMTISLNGDAPKHQMRNFKLQLQGLFSDAKPFSLTGGLNIGSVFLKEIWISKSDRLQLALKDIPLSIASHLNIAGSELFELQLAATSTGAVWDLKSSEDKVQQLLGQVLNRIKQVEMQTNFKGPWDKLSWSVTSNVGRQFVDSLKQEFEQQLNQLKEKLKGQISEKIADQKNKLLNSLSQSNKEFLEPVLANGNWLQNQDQILDQLKQKLEEKVKNKAKEKVNEKLGGELDQLKKKVKLPF